MGYPENEGETMQWEAAKDPDRDHVGAAYEAGVHAGQARTEHEPVNYPQPGEPTLDLVQPEVEPWITLCMPSEWKVGTFFAGIAVGLVLSLIIALAVFA